MELLLFTLIVVFFVIVVVAVCDVYTRDVVGPHDQVNELLNENAEYLVELEKVNDRCDKLEASNAELKARNEALRRMFASAIAKAELVPLYEEELAKKTDEIDGLRVSVYNAVMECHSDGDEAA